MIEHERLARITAFQRFAHAYSTFGDRMVSKGRSQVAERAFEAAEYAGQVAAAFAARNAVMVTFQRTAYIAHLLANPCLAGVT